MAAAFSLCSSLTPKLSQSQAPLTLSRSRTNISFLSHSLSSLTLTPRKQPTLYFTAKSTESDAEAEAAVPLSEPESEITVPENETAVPETDIAVPETEITVAETDIAAAETEITVAETDITAAESEITVPESEPSVEIPKPKREEVFAVVMVGSRQYIVFPGRYIYTQRLKGASVNDKITLNKVLLVGTKTSAYIGKPIVPNAIVQAVVEEQTLDKKVIVFKYKKKKNYRRNIGHRQPITRIRITSITGYQDSPVSTLP